MRTKLAAALLLACCSTLAVGPVGGADHDKPPFPDVRIPGFVRSEQAIQALRNRLPAVAAWYGKSVAELMALFRQDRTLWASPAGRLMYTCEIEQPLGADETTAQGATVIPSGSFPLDQTFRLHSGPGSNRVIYLDFDGQVVSGTAWNNGKTIDAAPFSLDSDPAFNSTELLRIQNIWKRVAEDFAPYDVDVTTEEPPLSALTRTSNSDTTFGNRIVITPTNFYPNGGGVSYVGVFDDTSEYYKTSWAFSNKLANSEKSIAEACSHEIGHSLGLHHDGVTGGTSYYQGQGNWAPIMGVGYYKNITQWCKGEYSGANNEEDQLLVMQNFGISYYSDDHGNNAGSATALSGYTSFSGSGFIERNTDVDVFKFVTGAGDISFGLSPAPLGPNLDILAEIRDSGWNLVAYSNPADLSASLSASVPAGTYYLTVTGTGYGDPLTTGYSGYASLGQYTFTGSVVDSGSLKPPVAVVSTTPTSGYAPLATYFSSAGSGDTSPGTIVAYSWNFGDGSPLSGAPNPSHTYSTAGDYTVTLTVTDNDGLTASDTVTVSVASEIYIASLNVEPQSSSSAAWAIASAVVKDAAGNLVSGATVSGSWSGVVSGTSSGSTGSNGTATLTSPQASSSGTITFTVTNVSAPNSAYNSSLNAQTSASADVTVTPEDPLSPPTNLKAAGARGKANLNWTDNSSGEDGYIVERAVSGSANFVLVGTLPPNAAGFTDSGLSRGNYDYRVAAVGSTGLAYSNVASARVKVRESWGGRSILRRRVAKR